MVRAIYTTLYVALQLVNAIEDDVAESSLIHLHSKDDENLAQEGVLVNAPYNYILAGNSQNCNDACTGQGKGTCDAAAGSAINSAAKVSAAAAAAGAACGQVESQASFGQLNDWDGPWRVGTKCGWSPTYSMTCTKNGNGDYFRICACKATTNVMGGNSQNCNDACTGQGKVCDAAAGSAINSAAKVSAAAAAAGAACGQVESQASFGQLNDWDGPWRVGTKCGWSPTYSMTCTKNGNGDYFRICACKPPTTTYVLAGNSQNCNDACIGKGICDPVAGSAINSADKVSAAAAAAGAACGQVESQAGFGQLNDWDGPWRVGTKCGWSPTYSMTCTKNGNGDYLRICACKAY